MTTCYTIRIHYRAVVGSERERKVLDCAKEYGCEADTHLIDRLLDDRLKIFEARKQEAARIAADEARIAEEKRRLNGGN